MIYISDPGEYFTIYKVDEKKDIGELTRYARRVRGKIFWTNSVYQDRNEEWRTYSLGWFTDELLEKSHYNCIRDIFQELRNAI